MIYTKYNKTFLSLKVTLDSTGETLLEWKEV